MIDTLCPPVNLPFTCAERVFIADLLFSVDDFVPAFTEPKKKNTFEASPFSLLSFLIVMPKTPCTIVSSFSAAWHVAGVQLRLGHFGPVPVAFQGLWDYAIRCHHCNVVVFRNVAVVAVHHVVRSIESRVLPRSDTFSTGPHWHPLAVRLPMLGALTCPSIPRAGTRPSANQHRSNFLHSLPTIPSGFKSSNLSLYRLLKSPARQRQNASPKMPTMQVFVIHHCLLNEEMNLGLACNRILSDLG